MKLLIVDDEVQIRTGLSEGVDWSSVGFETVLSAGNGMAAWELFKRHSPDVVITDIRMPRLDGIELSQRILEKTRFVRILILSGHSDFEYAKRAMQLGVADYELKPVKIRNLLTFAASARDSLMKERKDREETRRLLFARWIRMVLHAAPDAAAEGGRSRSRDVAGRAGEGILPSSENRRGSAANEHAGGRAVPFRMAGRISVR